MIGKRLVPSVFVLIALGAVPVQSQTNPTGESESRSILGRLDQFGQNLFGGIFGDNRTESRQVNPHEESLQPAPPIEREHAPAQRHEPLIAGRVERCLNPSRREHFERSFTAGPERAIGKSAGRSRQGLSSGRTVDAASADARPHCRCTIVREFKRRLRNQFRVSGGRGALTFANDSFAQCDDRNATPGTTSHPSAAFRLATVGVSARSIRSVGSCRAGFDACGRIAQHSGSRSTGSRPPASPDRFATITGGPRRADAGHTASRRRASRPHGANPGRAPSRRIAIRRTKPLDTAHGRSNLCGIESGRTDTGQSDSCGTDAVVVGASLNACRSFEAGSRP